MIAAYGIAVVALALGFVIAGAWQGIGPWLRAQVRQIRGDR